MSPERDRAASVIEAALTEASIPYEQPQPYVYVATLPGTHKLATGCSLAVGTHAVSVNAFVARRPDENHEAVYRWLLERNARMYGVAFAVDQHGDIYLAGKLALHAVTADEVDRVLGSVLEYADSSFEPLLELGFASAIRKEWEWRVKRGESLANLAPFARLVSGLPGPPDSPDSPDGSA